MRLILILAICGFVFATSAEAGAMKFQEVEFGCPEQCTRVLFGEGEIVYGTDRAFHSARRRTGGKLPVVLDSLGGDLPGALNLGYAFRHTKSSVAIVGDCFSACAFALFGGVERKAHRGARIGVHRFVEVGGDPRRPVATIMRQHARIVAQLIAYAEEMGVSPEVVRIAMVTPWDDDTIFSRSELKRLRITTGR